MINIESETKSLIFILTHTKSCFSCKAISSDIISLSDTFLVWVFQWSGEGSISDAAKVFSNFLPVLWDDFCSVLSRPICPTREGSTKTV